QTLGNFEIRYQDIQGGAWFDDINIWQVPRIVLGTQSPTNIIRAPDHPKIRTQIRDLAGGGLVADLRIYDTDRNLVAQTRQTVGNGQSIDYTWTPKLSRLGWHLVDLTLFDQIPSRDAAANSKNSPGPEPIARTFGAFLWLAKEPVLEPAEAARFVLDAT